MPGPDPIKNKKPKPKLMKNMSEREARKQAIKFKEDQKGKGRIIDGEFYPAMAKGGRAGFKSGSKFQDLVRGNLRDAAKTDAGTGNLKKFKKNVVMVTSGKRKGRIVPDTKDMEKKYGKENLKDLPGSFAKGGRAMLKAGGRGCKLAMKGKGRAYGKNS